MKLQIGNESMPSLLNDPFKKNKITRISVFYRELMRVWSATGTVEFTNGDTKGEQRFEGETFDEVTLKIKHFINNLENGK